MKRIAIVGSGPSGMYTAKYALKTIRNVVIDIFESLPSPYGLIRYGVAPDHADVKSVEIDFEKILASNHVNYFGNVKIGENLELNDLSKFYSAVVLCYGANGDRRLNFTEQKLTNSYSARDFVYWYNGHPFYNDIMFNLDKVSKVVVVGNGNVAIDCARILTKSTEDLKITDISEEALECLQKSNVEKVRIIGRRGPNQASFTIKELREIGKLSGVSLSIPSNQFFKHESDTDLENLKANRAKLRIYNLMREFVDRKPCGDKALELNFWLSPKQVISENNLCKNILVQPQQPVFVNDTVSVRDSDDWPYEIKADMIIESIGFKGEVIDSSIPFDKEKALIRHNGIGFVGNNLFTAGWIKRGPTGIVGTNIVCAKQTLTAVEQYLVDDKTNVKTTTDDIKRFLRAKKNENFVDYFGWKKIDAEEVSRGRVKNKPRSKIKSLSEMLEIAL